MGGIQSQRMAITFDDTFGDVQKRILQQETRPQIRTAADLLGPGLAPYAVLLQDWNDDATSFNGIFYSEPGAVNGPDRTSFWMGTSHASPDGFGIQRVAQYFGLTGNLLGQEWSRRFYDPGTSDRAYSAWALASDPRYVGEPMMWFSETPPNSRYLFANGMTLLRADYPELFGVYGVAHGSDDAAHFNLPDMRGRYPQGSHENIGYPPGSVDLLAPENRLARHSHSIAVNNDHTHAAGTLSAGLSADRAAGGLGRATQQISGDTGPSGRHDHGGDTGEVTNADFPHVRVAFHVRALP